MEVEMKLVNAGKTIRGMGVPEGITLVVGGGFHGKSTVLNALQNGVYDKIPGDGREGVVMRADAVKIRAEDGRKVESCDIERFITNLPGGRSTDNFSSEDASGSTSQAANVMEALEAGSRCLLFDEDTCATNFMIRDGKMAALVNAEPITPFISRVLSMKEENISTILVVGGAGDYLNVADKVIMMEDYKCYDVTDRAKQVCEDGKFKSQVPPVAGKVGGWASMNRAVDRGAFRPDLKCSVRSREKISYGDDNDLELGGLEQIVSKEMSNGILHAMHAIAREGPGQVSLRQCVETVLAQVEEVGVAKGLGGDACMDGGIAKPRKFEIMGAIGRLRLQGLLRKIP